MAKFMAAVANRKNGGESAAMQALLEECACLRQRVKELGDEQGSGSEKTVNTEADSDDLLEVVTLRKELNKAQNDKAAMELNFMNQLSAIARESAEKVGLIQKQLEQSQNRFSARASPSSRQQNEGEVEQLKEDLKAADKELQVTRKDVDDLYKKVDRLENQKSAVVDQLTELQLQVDNGSKVISSLNEAMEETEKHFQNKIDKLEAELSRKNILLTKQNEDLEKTNAEVDRVVEQKTMLLDEITDLRMQLDRNDDATQAMQKKLDELNSVQSGQEESSRIGFLKQAAMKAEEKSEEVQAKMASFENEMRSVTKSYKETICRLEEAAALKETEYDNAKKMLSDKDLLIKKLEDQKGEFDNARKGLELKLEENERNIADLQQQLVAQGIEYASQQKEHILSVANEGESAKDQLAGLERQVKSLEKKLAFETETNGRLKAQLLEAKKHRPSPISTTSKRETTSLSTTSKRDSPTLSTTSKRDPPPPFESYKPSFPPNTSIFRNRSESPATSPAYSTVSDPPSNRSVKALAACFETNKNVRKSDHRILAEGPIFSFPEPEAEVPEAEVPEGPDVDDLRRQINDLESQLDEAKSHNAFLQEKLNKQCEQVAELHADIALLNATRASIKDSSRKAVDQVRLENQATIGRLEMDLVTARKQLEVESKMVEKLQKEVHEMTSERLAYEECTMDAFEKQKLKGQKSHQSELNNLRNDLTNAQMRLASMEREHEKHVKELEDTIEEVNEECDKELEEKAGEVDMFKHMYEQQLDMVTNLEKERSQLYSQMKISSNSRRDEIDELQADLMDKSAALASLQRELQTIQMQVEHQTDNTKELEYLRERVRDLEKLREPKGTAKHLKVFEIEKLEEENRKLKEQVRSITVERRGLQERLKAVVEEHNAVRTQPQVLRERNEKLKHELARLSRKLEKFESGGAIRIAI